MNPEPNPVETEAASLPARPRRSLIIGGAVLVIALLAIGGWFFYHRSASFLTGATLYVSPSDAGEVPISSVSFDKAKPGIAPLAVGKSEGKYAIDMVRDGKTTYYLLLDPSTLVSNIYRQEGDGALAQVTDTPTFKNYLSYDAKTGVFVYQSAKAKTVADLAQRESWDLEAFSAATGAETALGAGAKPSFLSDSTLVIENAHAITLVDLATGVRRPVATALGPWAIDAAKHQLALYNPQTHAVDFFALTESAASYSESKPLSYVPILLAYAKGNLILMRTIGDPSLLGFSYLDGRSIAFPNPYNGWSIRPNKLILAYE